MYLQDIDIDKCFEICNKNEAFFFKKEEINGESFLIFNYRLAWYDDFKKIPGSQELRGLTFNLDTNERWWSLHKFFNVNEHQELSVEKIIEENKKEFYVSDKVDGSLIQVIRGRNGDLYAKTKGTFFSEQAKLAQNFIDTHPNYYKFITFLYENGYQCIFEVISPKNQVVVYYPETTLMLLAIRDVYGKYYNLNEFFMPLILKYDIDFVQTWSEDINSLLNKAKFLEQLEGWIITSKNNSYHKWKIKTDWYLSLHKVVAEN